MAQFTSSTLTLWKRGIQRGWITVWRERGWSTALGALLGVFVLLQLLILLFLGAEGIQSLLRAQTDLRLEIKEEAATADIQQFLSSLEQLPYIENSVYITREQAYAQMKRRDPELITFIEEFQLDNPFPETVGVTLASLDDYPVFKTFIEDERWHGVVDAGFLTEATEQEAQVYELIRLTNTGKSLVTFFLGITTFVLVFITTELVRRRVLSKSEEVMVEQLSGAHTFGILLPFATEATVLLLTALLASAVVTVGLLYGLPYLLPALAEEEAMFALISTIKPLLITMMPILLLVQALITPLLGWFGAWLGMVHKVNMRSLVLHS